jgi:UPF0271 protein
MRGSSEEDVAIVFDTAAFLAGLHLLIKEKIFTVEEVIREVKDSYSSTRLIYGLEADRVEIIDVEKNAFPITLPDRLKEKLSETDLKVISLALLLRSEGKDVLVFTDDYALQQSLRMLGINFKPVRHRGIKEK